MSIKQLNKVIQKYRPNYTFESLSDLFSSYVAATRCCSCPTEYLWLRLPTNRDPLTWLYIKPTEEFKTCLSNVYGEPRDEHIYLEVFEKPNGQIILKMNYQHLIGGKFLCEITPEQLQQLVEQASK